MVYCIILDPRWGEGDQWRLLHYSELGEEGGGPMTFTAQGYRKIFFQLNQKNNFVKS